MALSVLSFVLLLSLANCVVGQETPKTKRSNATYWVTFPSRMRRGMAVPVSVRLLAPGAKSTVQVTLRNSTDGRVFSSAEPQVVTGGSPSVINLMIPRDISIPDSGNPYFEWFYQRQFEIRVVATGDVSFNQSGGLIPEKKSCSIFVQTDKAIYNPGETVRMRILAMNPNLTVLNEPMSVSVRNQYTSMVRQWTGVSGNNSGVVELSIPTSDRLDLGVWTIEVQVLGVNKTKTFIVADYVLPKYEARVDVPSSILATDPVRGTASAKYTFGKPLVGAKVEVTAKFKYYWEKTPQPNISLNGTLDSKGEFPFTFNTSDLVELVNKTFPGRFIGKEPFIDYTIIQIIVNVTDPTTGLQTETQAEVEPKSFLAKVEFLPISSKNFKPGLLYTAYLLVTRHDGTIFTNPESVTVDFEITILRANNTATTTTNTTTNSTTTNTTTTTTNTTTLLQSLKDQKNIPVYGHPSFYEIPEFSEQYKEKKTLTVNGFLSIEVNVPENAKRIEILATVMNMTRGVTVLRSDSPSGNFLHLLLTSRNPEVGQVVEFTARTTEPVKRITYQVYAKGTMVFESEVASPVEAGNQTFSISFTLTPVMAPHCRVLAFYLRDNGEVVPDSLSINVKATLDNPVDVGFTVETAKPGDTVNLVISAKPNTTVFLLSDDKNVQLLKSGNDITQEMITEELVSYDYSFMFYGFWYDMFLSGFPYPSKGSDANKVFKDADVVILTDGLVYDNQYTRYPNFVMASFPRKIVEAAVSLVSGVRRISKNVPETWLWNMVTVGSSGKYTLSEVAPNAIVTWQTTAIAVHPVFGLSVTPKAAEITTYPSVFVTLDTPDSAMRGEDICFKAFAFNYYNTSLELTLTMGSIDGIQVSKEGQKSTNLSHSLGQVDPDNVRDTDFCFTPVKLGPLPIRVNLTTTSVPGDSVEQIILVKPEGKPKAVKQ